MAYQVGTVFVNVVPSLRGFSKTIAQEVSASAPAAGAAAGKAAGEKFKDSAKGAAKKVSDEWAGELNKSVPRLRREAENAAGALAKAQEKVKKASGELEAARKREVTVSVEVAKAEKQLAAARASGDQEKIAAAEKKLAAAKDAAAAADRKADDAAAAYTRALAVEDKAVEAASRANRELAAATASTSAVQVKAAGSSLTLSKAMGAVTASVRTSNAAMAGMLGSVKGLLGPMLGLAAIGGSGMGLMASFNAAKELEQSVGAVEDVFKSAGAEMKEFSKTSYKTVGLSADKFNKMSTILGSQLKNAGVPMGQLAGKTKDLIKIGADFSAMYGGTATEAVEAMSSALKGEFNPIEKYGISLRQSTIDAKAASMGFKKLGGSYDQTARTAATLALISEQGRDALGKWDRETGTAEHQQQVFREQLEDTAAQIGAYLTPAYTAITKMLNEQVLPAIQGAIKWLDEHDAVVESVAISVGLFVAAWGGLSILTMVRGWLKATEISMLALNKAVKANWVIIAIAAIAALIGGLVHLYKTNEKFREVVDKVWSAVSGFISTAWNDYIKPVFDAIYDFVTNTLAPSIEGLWSLLTEGKFTKDIFGFKEDSGLVKFLKDGREAAIKWGKALQAAWRDYIKPALAALWDFMKTHIIPIFTEAWEEILKPLFENAGYLFGELWEGVLKPGLENLGTLLSEIVIPALKELWEIIEPHMPIITAMFKGFFLAVMSPFIVFAGILRYVVIPAISLLVDYYIIPMSRMFVWALQGMMYVATTVFQAIVWWIKNVIGPAFSAFYRDYVKPVVEWVTNKLDQFKTFFTANVAPKLVKAVQSIGQAFTTMRDVITRAWDAVRAVAARGANFVITTVYMGGIKRGFDAIAGAVGIKSPLPVIKPIGAYARGGALPGFTPGRDIYRFYDPVSGLTVDLGGGEGILVPEALRALGGKPWLDRVNRTHGRGVSTQGDYGAGHVAFAKGGVFDAVGGLGRAGWKVLTGATDFVSNVFMDPLGAIRELIEKPAKALLGTLDSGAWGKILAAIPNFLFSGLGGFLKRETDKTGGGGMGLVNAARKYIGVPYIWGGSTVPPGLDCSGLVYRSYNDLGKRVPRLRAMGFQSASKIIPDSQKKPGDLLFWKSPASHVAIYAGNNRLVEAPKPGSNVREVGLRPYTNAGRYLYDQGGQLPPGLTLAMNATGKPERILTENQWGVFERIAAGKGGDTFNISVPKPAASADEIVDAAFFKKRHLAFSGTDR